MRVLMVADFPADPTLGSPKVNFKLQEELRRAGCRCDVLFREEIGAVPRTRQLRDVTVPLLVALAVARRVPKSGGYDVIDVTSEGSLFLPALRAMGLLGDAAIVARSNGLEHRSMLRLEKDRAEGLIPKRRLGPIWFGAVKGPAVRFAATMADGLVVLTQSEARFASDWIDVDRIHVVPHGVSTNLIHQAPHSGAPRGAGALFVGTWTEMKGIHYLAGAFDLLAANHVVCPLTIVGGGYPEAHIRSYFSSAAQPLIQIRNRVPEQELIDLYRAHDFLVMSSTYEGFCMAVVEAMTQRLPVVATPTGVVEDALCDEKTALVVPLRDSSALAAAIMRMHGDAELRRRLADEAWRIAVGYTWERSAARLIEVYQAIINQRLRSS